VRNSYPFEYTLGIFKKTLFTCHSAILKDINFPKAHIWYEHILKVSNEDVKIYKD